MVLDAQVRASLPRTALASQPCERCAERWAILACRQNTVSSHAGRQSDEVQREWLFLFEPQLVALGRVLHR